MNDSGGYLHKASYLIPVSSDSNLPTVITNGAVLTENGRITAVGSYAKLRGADALEVDHGTAVLMPALVNCHSHLELSYLARLGQGANNQAGDITGWIKTLLTEREKEHDPQEVEMAAWQALARLYAGGCRGLLDIGNLPASRDIAKRFKVNSRFFQEILGLTSPGIEAGLALIDSVKDDPELFYTAHAPYSTAPELLKQLKARANRHGHLFPIHVAESTDEMEFLATDQGRFRAFLEERGALDDSFQTPGQSPIAYLDSLGVLDERTLCVHCVHCDADDIAIMAERQVRACICPGSNRFLGVGTAPVPQLLESGIDLVLGTDSLTSNPHLSLWEEMRVLSQDHPGLKPLDIIRMVTRNGAEFMGLAKELGSLTPGCSASFLAVSGDLPENGSGSKILKWLVSAGLKITTEWVE
ncbi:MAG: amidohydrolase family protein [Thermodesulfobacteriota bacterium]